MSIAKNSRTLRPDSSTRSLLLKWIVALLVPLAIFLFVWNGEAIMNNVMLGIFSPAATDYATSDVIQAGIFMVVFFASVITLAGYLTAADTGRRALLEVWIDILVFVIVPLLLVIITQNLILGMAICAIVWAIYFVVRARVRKARPAAEEAPLAHLEVVDAEHRVLLRNRAILGSFWFAATLAIVWLIVDVIFITTGPFPLVLMIWVAARTILLPVTGYFLGRLGAVVALRRVVVPKAEEAAAGNGRVSKQRVLETLSAGRAQEEAKDLVPNDRPLRSSGAQRFYLLILIAFVLLFPVLDPLLFGPGTAGRFAGYGDAGYYVILALGLNIVVGFAGLLDLGYVAFFAIGAYTWAMVGSTQFTSLTGIVIHPASWSLLFWPMLLGAAIIAAFWGVVLGIPTLRLKGDYLAIVTLGFGEIIPIIFLEMDKYTNGVNGIPGVLSPKFFGLDWSNITPIPFYYLILALIALLIFVNIRLRDSRLGRAWVAIREDEIAASSSGINLVNTKLLAFGAGAFFSGIAGVYHAAKLGTVSPDAFSSQDSIIYLAMVVIGGLGSIPGVIVGAFVVYAINLFILAQLDTLAADPTNFFHVVLIGIQHVIPSFTFGSIRNLLFGTILVCVMLFRPEGLIPSARRRRELHRAETEGPEFGALDAMPGSPEFEAEVHVE